MGTVEEMHHGSNLIELDEHAWEKTSWKVASACMTIHACHLSCLLASLICLSWYFWTNSYVSWTNSHSSWALALLTSCRSLRAGWKPDCPSILVPSSWWGWGANKGTKNEIWLERQFSFSELCHRASQKWETLSTPSLPLLKARPPWCQRRGVICIETAGLVGIGWKKHPRECAHL